MTDADQLAQRYLALWTEYLTALLADPRAMETLKRWMAFAGQFSYPAPGAAQAGSVPFPAWPPFFGPFGSPPVPPGASDPPGEIARLTRRVAELERRLTALENLPKPRRPRGTRAAD